MKKVIKILLSLISIIIVIVGLYFLYVYLAYHRVEDNLNLEVINNNDSLITTNKEYSILSYNIGFAAYSPDFSFFMDGGEYSRAISRDEVLNNMNTIINNINKENTDIILIPEADTDSTRTYHVNQYELLSKNLTNYSNVFAINYDSPYLFYPITLPHGKSQSSIVTYTKFKIDSSLRRSLPLEDGVRKLLDYDRAYTKSRISINNKELIIYNTHLSAYTKDDSITKVQLQMLLNDMQEEYNKGNYVLCVGDFNKDLLGDTSKYTGIKAPEELTWAVPLDTSLFNNTNLSLIAPLDESHPIISCRDAGVPLSDTTFLVTIDGFIVSDNIEVLSSKVVDTNFNASDHNPVRMQFKLIEE